MYFHCKASRNSYHAATQRTRFPFEARGRSDVLPGEASHTSNPFLVPKSRFHAEETAAQRIVIFGEPHLPLYGHSSCSGQCRLLEWCLGYHAWHAVGGTIDVYAWYIVDTLGPANFILNRGGFHTTEAEESMYVIESTYHCGDISNLEQLGLSKKCAD